MAQGSAPKTYVYVDGFNLYFGALKGTGYKWLDLRKLMRQLLPQHDVLQIRYFTARVSALPQDLQQPRRQEAYLRALRTLPNFSIHFGQFLVHPTRLRLVTVKPGGPKYADVLKSQEKGSDVNLATHLLVDAVQGCYDEAVVVSNDSDLMAPIRAVRTVFSKPVGVLHPHAKPSKELHATASFCRGIPPGALQACQFPPQIVDANGRKIYKPKKW
jgi:uncharacterized LabA/DUF88 family protein